MRNSLVPLPPRSKRNDLSTTIPYTFIRHKLFRWECCLVFDGRVSVLFKRVALWPTRKSSRNMLYLASRMDNLMDKVYQRGFDSGQHPDDAFMEPQVHDVDGSPHYVHLFPFGLKRIGKNHWVLAFNGWGADLRLRRSGIELEVRK